MPKLIPLQNLLEQVRSCTLCEKDLPLGPRPVVRANSNAKILIIGQAPGTKVHASGTPWDDASGNRLRAWMGISPEVFYNEQQIAIMPMGFCYPGRGKSGDLPPRKECAPQWHQALLAQLPNIQCTLFIGNYAQNYYLDNKHKNLTERVKAWRDYFPTQIPLVHPSPRNQIWLKKNPWFEQNVVPQLQQVVTAVLDDQTL